MATPVISLPTAVDSSPLLTIGDEKPDKGVRLGQATKSSKALKEATADHQDTSDSDDQALEDEKKLEVQADTSDSDEHALESEKEVEVQADTKDKRRPSPRPQPQPRLQSSAAAAALDAAPSSVEPLVPPGPRPAASTEHDTVSTKTNGTDAKKQQKGASDDASGKSDAKSETVAADAGVRKSRLPFRRNENGPRKGGKQKEKGALGRACEKLKMGFFGKKKKEPVEEANPYANPMTPYQQVRNDLAQGARTGAPGGLPSNPRLNSFASSTAPPPYQSPSVASDNSRFGDEKYGNQNGYGSNRYDNDNASAFSANQSRAGGYGGFGDDAGSNELFGGASGRYVPPQQGSKNSSPAGASASFKSPPGRYDNDPSKGALLGNAQDRYNPLPQSSRQEAPAEDDEYGGYGAPRELTEEEKDEQEVQNIKDETKAVRRAGVDTSGRIRAQADNIRAMAAQTAARTAAQGERLHRTDQNMNIAAAHSRVAEGNIKELKRIDGSMFSVWTPNSKSKKQKAEDEMMQQYRADKEAQESSRHNKYRAEADMEETFNNASKPKQKLLGGRSAESRKNYDFENDSEDEKMEDDINDNLDYTMDTLGQIKELAIGTNREITAQNELLSSMNKKSDAVDDQVRLNRSRLNHFH